MTANQSIEAPVTPDQEPGQNPGQDDKLARVIAEQEAICVGRQPGSAARISAPSW